jgi:hypothetical protein
MKTLQLFVLATVLILLIPLSACAPSQAEITVSATPTSTPNSSPTGFPTLTVFPAPNLRPVPTSEVGAPEIPTNRYLFVEYGIAQKVAKVPGNNCGKSDTSFDGPRAYWREGGKLIIPVDRVALRDVCGIALCTSEDRKLVVDLGSVPTQTFGFVGWHWSTGIGASGGTEELTPITSFPFHPQGDMTVLSVDYLGTIVVKIEDGVYLMEPNQSWSYTVEDQVSPECWRATEYTLTNLGLWDRDKVEICYECPF